MRIIDVVDAGRSRAFQFNRPYAHISFRENTAMYPPRVEDPSLVAFLEIVLHDFRHYAQAHEPQNEPFADQIPRPESFKELPRFIADTASRVEGYLINCGAGASRSAGLAVALGSLFGQSVARFFQPPYNPNPMVTQSALIAFQLWPADVPWQKLYDEGPSLNATGDNPDPGKV